MYSLSYYVLEQNLETSDFNFSVCTRTYVKKKRKSKKLNEFLAPYHNKTSSHFEKVISREFSTNLIAE